MAKCTRAFEGFAFEGLCHGLRQGLRYWIHSLAGVLLRKRPSVARSGLSFAGLTGSAAWYCCCIGQAGTAESIRHGRQTGNVHATGASRTRAVLGLDCRLLARLGRRRRLHFGRSSDDLCRGRADRPHRHRHECACRGSERSGQSPVPRARRHGEMALRRRLCRSRRGRRVRRLEPEQDGGRNKASGAVRNSDAGRCRPHVRPAFERGRCQCSPQSPKLSEARSVRLPHGGTIRLLRNRPAQSGPRRSPRHDRRWRGSSSGARRAAWWSGCS